MPTTQQPHLIEVPKGWTPDRTERYLNAFPLPEGFTWLDRNGHWKPVRPAHAERILEVQRTYGKWLAETPYFPGLFELIHRLMVLHPGETVPTSREMAEKLEPERVALRLKQAVLPI